jgi:hypothetical protein
VNRLGQMRIARLLFGSLAILTAFACSLIAGPGVAHAVIAFEPGGLVAQSFDGAGNAEDQAGAHPFRYTTEFNFAPREDGFVTEYAKDIHVKLPPGIVGNPEAVPTCPRSTFTELIQDPGAGPKCPEASQVGAAIVTVRPYGLPEEILVPVFLLNPPSGSVSQLGMPVLTVPVTLDLGVDSAGNYGIEVNSPNTSQGLPVSGVKVNIWGVPADSSHDSERTCGTAGNGHLPATPCSVSDPRTPFLSNPTRCEPAGSARMTVNSWEDTTHYSASESAVFATTGCERIQFEPDLSTQMQAQAGSPTGLSVNISTPQGDDPKTGLAQGIMRDVSVTLPKGVTISASSANELEACSDAQLGLGSKSPSTCPDGSKLGSVVATTPLLDHPLEGSVYLRSQASNDPGSGEMFRLAIVLSDPERGLLIKLPGQVQVNAQTGQVETTFAENPELPVSGISLNLKAGPRAPLVTPTECGTYVASYRMTAWSGQVATGTSPMVVNQNCGPRGFSPSLSAGTINPVAGAYSPFTLRLTQGDGQQNLSALDVSLPKGMLAKLAGVGLCGDADIQHGTCPAQSQVGSATIGAGVGLSPVYVPQPGKAPTAVSLAGPYKGAPYSLVVQVPAQAGPFDLGTVTVRNAIYIDPVTTQITVKSDPLPQIIQGVPITYRDVRINVDRPGFTLNPTSCDQTEVGSTITSAAGSVASPRAAFQVADCANLDLKPKLALRFSGAPTRRGGHPKLTATLTTGKNESNLKQVQVTLPKTEYLENAHIKTVCTRVQYAADQCPEGSIYGYAKAWTPLLDKPLEGPVYLRSSNNKLPDLVASLDGQIHVDLDGRISSYRSRIRNTFEAVPDAPVSKFVLTMQGGGKGLLVNNTNICKASPKATAVFDGQNGKTVETNPLVSVAGCGKGGKKGKKKLRFK